MMSVRSFVATTVCAAAAVSLTACGGGSSGPSTTIGPNSILVANLAYKPTGLSVKVGDTVTWVFKDSVAHNVDGASDLSDFSSSYKTSGTYSYTFKKAGSYSYHCDVHPFMKGTVTVA